MGPIVYLEGSISTLGHGLVLVVTRGGVGYQVVTHDAFQPSEANNSIWIWHVIGGSDGSQRLFGFLEPEDVEWAKLLSGVPGVGPLIASRCIHFAGRRRVLQALSDKRPADLQKAVKGLGKKGAEALVRALHEQALTVLQQSGLTQLAGQGSLRVRHLTSALQGLGHLADPHRVEQLISSHPDEALGKLVRLYIEQHQDS